MVSVEIVDLVGPTFSNILCHMWRKIDASLKAWGTAASGSDRKMMRDAMIIMRWRKCTAIEKCML